MKKEDPDIQREIDRHDLNNVHIINNYNNTHRWDFLSNRIL